MIKWIKKFFRKVKEEARTDRALRKGGYPPYNDKHLRWWK